MLLYIIKIVAQVTKTRKNGHSKLSGVPLDTLGREDWGNTQLGDILDSTGSGLAVHVAGLGRLLI